MVIVGFPGHTHLLYDKIIILTASHSFGSAPVFVMLLRISGLSINKCA